MARLLVGCFAYFTFKGGAGGVWCEAKFRAKKYNFAVRLLDEFLVGFDAGRHVAAGGCALTCCLRAAEAAEEGEKQASVLIIK